MTVNYPPKLEQTMVYDNTKLSNAVDQWLKEQVEFSPDYSQYSKELLDAFMVYAMRTKLLKRSPGRVAFGHALKSRGYESRQVEGLSHWIGLRLKQIIPPPMPSIPPRMSEQLEEAETERRERAEQVKQKHFNDEAKEQRRREVLEEMQQENADRIRGVE